METRSQKEFDAETKNELKLLLYDNYKNGMINIKSNSKTIENEEDEEYDDEE